MAFLFYWCLLYSALHQPVVMLISELCVAAKAHRRSDWRKQQVQQSNGGKADPENGNKSQEPWRPVETVDGQIERSCQYNVFEFNNTLHQYKQGSFPAGTPGNGVPKVILTVGTQLNHANQLYMNCTKSTVYTKIRPFKIQNRKIVLVRGRIPSPPHTSILAPSALELGVPRVIF